jgi:glycosyltransferase involved in cell wall biosynthesis
VKRILIITPNLQGCGGVANYYTTLKDYYSMDVEYFTVGKRNSREGKLAGLSRFVKDNIVFKKKLKEAGFALIHLNPSLRDKAVVRDGVFLHFAKQAGKKVVVFFRGWDKGFESRLEGWKLKLFKKVYFEADAMIVLAEEFKARLRAWGYRGLICVETTTFDDKWLEGFNIKNKLKVRDKVFNLLFLARIVKEKGIYEALEAYHLVRSRGWDIRFTVAGDGSELSAVKQFVKEKQIVAVHLPGFVAGTDKIRFLKEADLFILPSYEEGMPNSVVEAMAFGLPIVTRPVGGICDFFEYGKMGFVTESKDPEVFAKLMEILILDDNLRFRIGQFNHEYAKEHFMASQVAKRIESIYQNVLSNATGD